MSQLRALGLIVVLLSFVWIQSGSAAVDNAAIDTKLNDVLSRFEQLEHKNNVILRRLELLDRKDSSCTPLAAFKEFKEFNEAKIVQSVSSGSSSSSSSRARLATGTNAGLCATAGVQQVTFGGSTFQVLCEKRRWLVVLQRFDGTEKFHNRVFSAYKSGFGTVDPNKEFFLGLEHLHQITATGQFDVYFKLVDFDDVHAWAQYDSFSVGDEQSAYKLNSLGDYLGTAGDSFAYHEGQGFTTLDRDNDGKKIGSCGEEYSSAGWFKSCMEANIFGNYLPAKHDHFKEGMYWETFGGPETSLKSVKVMIRARF